MEATAGQIPESLSKLKRKLQRLEEYVERMPYNAAYRIWRFIQDTSSIDYRCAEEILRFFDRFPEVENEFKWVLRTLDILIEDEDEI